MNECRAIVLSLVPVATLPFLAFGALVVRTEMPLSLFADTEISTNIVFAAYEPKQRQFAYELVFDATPTNNFEAAFGRDGDGNGIITRDEVDFTVGWDCGEWFARVTERVAGDEEIAATNLVAQDVGPVGERRLRVVFATGSSGNVRSASAQLCAPGTTNELFAAPFVWPYDPQWNRARLTARGFDEPTASFSFKTTVDGSTITLR